LREDSDSRCELADADASCNSLSLNATECTERSRRDDGSGTESEAKPTQSVREGSRIQTWDL